METNGKSNEDDMLVLSPLSNADPPSHMEMDKHLHAAKEEVSRTSSKKPVNKVQIPKGYVMTTRPEIWKGYKLDAKSTVL